MSYHRDNRNGGPSYVLSVDEASALPEHVCTEVDPDWCPGCWDEATTTTREHE